MSDNQTRLESARALLHLIESDEYGPKGFPTDEDHPPYLFTCGCEWTGKYSIFCSDHSQNGIARAALDELAGIDLTPDATAAHLLHEAWAYIEDLPGSDDWQFGWLERVRAWNAGQPVGDDTADALTAMEAERDEWRTIARSRKDQVLIDSLTAYKAELKVAQQCVLYEGQRADVLAEALRKIPYHYLPASLWGDEIAAANAALAAYDAARKGTVQG